jgi:hypothetical protein
LKPRHGQFARYRSDSDGCAGHHQRGERRQTDQPQGSPPVQPRQLRLGICVRHHDGPRQAAVSGAPQRRVAFASHRVIVQRDAHPLAIE